MGATENLAGKIFGNLEVLYRADNRNGRTMWVCKCSCGNLITRYSKTLKNGKTRSCGCLRKRVSNIRATSHGMRYSKEYKIWAGMKARCRTVSASGYAKYGGVGISYDPSWEFFVNFYQDMGPCPTNKHSLDRVDNTKGYSKENCRWATPLQQNTNQRRSIYINGKTLRNFANEIGTPYHTAYGRYKRGEYADLEGG